MYLILIQDDDAAQWGLSHHQSIVRVLRTNELLKIETADYAHLADPSIQLANIYSCEVVVLRLSTLINENCAAAMQNCVSQHVQQCNRLRVFIHYGGQNMSDFINGGLSFLRKLWLAVRDIHGLKCVSEEFLALPISGGGGLPWQRHLVDFQNSILSGMPDTEHLDKAYEAAREHLGIKADGDGRSIAVARPDEIITALFPFALEVSELAGSGDEASLEAAYRCAYARSVQLLAGKQLPDDARFVEELFPIQKVLSAFDNEKAMAFRGKFLAYQGGHTQRLRDSGKIIVEKLTRDQ